MVVVHIQLGVDLPVFCVQCSQLMKLEGQQIMNRAPVLKCPTCGFRIRIQSTKQPAVASDIRQRIPEYRPPPRA